MDYNNYQKLSFKQIKMIPTGNSKPLERKKYIMELVNI